MVAVGSRSKQFKVKNSVKRCRIVGAFQTSVGGLETEEFSSDPRCGSSAREFIGFGEEGGGG